jgi:predicted O-methyltransferase YrrM
MTDAFDAVAREYQERAEAEDKLIHSLPFQEVLRRADEFLLPVGRATATLLNLLVKESKSRSILEIGTSLGYSTLWLAEAARATGGQVITVELREVKAEHARRQIERAGLSQWVEFRIGDARSILKEVSGPFDFVLIDLWKDLYVASFDLVYPKLARGATIVADNMLIPEAARQDALAYRNRVKATPNMTSVLLPVGSGIEVSRYEAG